MKFYLDYSKNIEVDIDLGGMKPSVVGIKVREYFKDLNPKIKENLLWNLRDLIEIKQHYDDFNKYILQIGGEEFFEFDVTTEEVVKKHLLTSFEVRRLGQAKYRNATIGEGKYDRPAIFPRSEHKEFKIKTDLHAHLSAILSGEALIEVGRDNNILYPLKLAKSIGLNVDDLVPDEQGFLKLNDILEADPENFNALKDSLEICPYTNETFNRMEEIYKAREPFTKNKDILEPILWKIAEKYVENGVEYAELSSTEVIRDVEFLSKMHEILPEIEAFWAERGKKINIRFLAAIARDAIKEKKEDEIDILKAVAKSPYIVGCDFLGHESNPASAITSQIAEITRWASTNDPDFTIRVHAGETDIFNNVEVSLKAMQDAFYAEKAVNSNAKLPPIRIGHAVYKVKTDEVDRLAEELGAVFECNATSNYGLNNISDYNSPLRKNLDKGIPTVIGTDGFGLYGTSPMHEVVIAKGRKIKDFSLVTRTEEKIIDRSTKRFEEKKVAFDKAVKEQLNKLHRRDISSLFKVDYRNGSPQYDGTKKYSIDNENREARRELIDFLEKTFEMSGANILKRENYADFERKIAGKKTILIVNNALRTNSEDMLKGDSKEDEDFILGVPEARDMIDFLIENSDPEKTFFVIGGIKYGAEKYLISQLKKSDKKFDVLNFVTEQAIMRRDVTVEPKVITDAIIIENRSSNILSSNFLLPKEMGDFMKEHNGVMLALGGSAVVADMVQYAFNVGDIDIYLSSQIKGTARNKTRQYTDFTRNRKNHLGGSIFSFENSKEFEKLISEMNPELFVNRRGRGEQIDH